MTACRGVDLLARDLLINVTSFFRDPKAFELLAEEVIPDLVHRQPSDRPLRIAARPQTGRCHEPAFQTPRQTQQPPATR
jgi:hypothetical protein